MAHGTVLFVSTDAPSGAEFLSVLHAAMRAVRCEADAQLGEQAVSPGQVRMLRVLAREGGTARPGELADALGVNPRSVTSKVDAAERDGHVVRRPDPSDRRATLVELTARGREALEHLGRLRASGAGGLLEHLSGAEQRELVRLLHKVVDDGRCC
jgi:DNA-binding MarR family transcriptional regulator